MSDLTLSRARGSLDPGSRPAVPERSAWPGLVPVVVVLAFAVGLGGFHAGVDARAALAGQGILLALAAMSAGGWRDPLRLSPGSWRLLALAGMTLLLSWYQSPVPRAGRTALLMLPALVLVPSAVARCLSTNRRRNLFLVGIALISTYIYARALWSGWRTESTVGPLGHHNLLAAWVVTTLPLVAALWRGDLRRRLLAVLAGGSGLGALAVSGSRSGWAALAVVVVVATSVAGRRARRALLGVTALVLVVGGLRWGSADGVLGDPSVSARLAYWDAAWRGALERPLLGWGPGASAWTLHLHLEPEPGVHPASQIVADPHNLPLRLLYELGFLGVGILIALGVVFLRRRWLDRRGDVDPALRTAAALGLLGWSVISLAGRPLAAPALPVLALVLLGVWLAADGEAAESAPATRSQPVVLAVVLAVLLLPSARAHLLYDQAAASEDPAQRRAALGEAVALDPGFPLYRFHLALESEAGPTAAEQARRAAEDAVGLAPLWLAAANLAEDPDLRRAALLETCRLDPLASTAPWRLSLLGRDPRRVAWTARAFLAEPRLLAAYRRPPPETLAAAARRLGGLEGLEPPWSRALGRLLREVGEPSGAGGSLVLRMDADPATALSTHAFRRRPWPTVLAETRLAAEAVGRVDRELGPARASAEIFRAAECALP